VVGGNRRLGAIVQGHVVPKNIFLIFPVQNTEGYNIYREGGARGGGGGAPAFPGAATATRACERLRARTGAHTYVYACTCTRTIAYRHTRSLNAHRSKNFLNFFEKGIDK